MNYISGRYPECLNSYCSEFWDMKALMSNEHDSCVVALVEYVSKLQYQLFPTWMGFPLQNHLLLSVSLLL